MPPALADGGECAVGEVGGGAVSVDDGGGALDGAVDLVDNGVDSGVVGNGELIAGEDEGGLPQGPGKVVF